MGDRQARYRRAQEWITLITRLWTETEEIDFDYAAVDATAALITAAA